MTFGDIRRGYRERVHYAYMALVWNPDFNIMD